VRTTNVEPSQLNFDHYTVDKYDRDIVNSIPFHHEIHGLIESYVREHFHPNEEYAVIDLGVGTAITSRIVKDALPRAHFDLVDFSRQMLEGAKRTMGRDHVHYILADYSEMGITKQYDIVISVIGLHHQNEQGKKKLFAKVYNMLRPGGVFILGDLVTYRDKYVAAANAARHYKELVDKSSDEATLSEWAYHHMFLNDPSPIEDQMEWLAESGFRQVSQTFLRMNTALVICRK
jgi:tRNA (cmo5U34)-methyltransferase